MSATHDISDTDNLPMTPAGLRAYADAYEVSVAGDEDATVFTLEYQWQDKKHRHVFDLCARLRSAANALDEALETLQAAADQFDLYKDGHLEKFRHAMKFGTLDEVVAANNKAKTNADWAVRCRRAIVRAREATPVGEANPNSPTLSKAGA